MDNVIHTPEVRRIVKVYLDNSRILYLRGGVTGPKGEGSAVPGIYSGNGPPSDDILKDAAIGSTYIDNTNGNIYKKES